jgi:hypothetical protein
LFDIKSISSLYYFTEHNNRSQRADKKKILLKLAILFEDIIDILVNLSSKSDMKEKPDLNRSFILIKIIQIEKAPVV